MSWFRKTYPEVLIFAIPNGGQRSKVTAVKLQAEGVLSGVPDLFVPAWGLFIEMKRQRGGSVSPDQKDIIPKLREAGYAVEIARGCEAAMAIAIKYSEKC